MQNANLGNMLETNDIDINEKFQRKIFIEEETQRSAIAVCKSKRLGA